MSRECSKCPEMARNIKRGLGMTREGSKPGACPPPQPGSPPEMLAWLQGLGFILQGSGLGSYGLGFRDWGSGFRVWSFGFRVSGLWFLVHGLWLSAQGVGFRNQGSGFRLQHLGFRDQVLWFSVEIFLVFSVCARPPRTGLFLDTRACLPPDVPAYLNMFTSPPNF